MGICILLQEQGKISMIPLFLFFSFVIRVIFSRPAVEKIVSSQFTCPSADYPDDMFLGSLTRILNISLFDSSLFHQVHALQGFDF